MEPVTGTVRVGLLGCGNVGTALVRLLDDHADTIAARAGVRIAIGRVAVRDPAKARDTKLPAEMFTSDAMSVVLDPDLDVVVEVMGGVDPAHELVAAALEAGKPVVTANKELIATVGFDLIEVAQHAGVDLLFEASVAGGIPLLPTSRMGICSRPATGEADRASGKFVPVATKTVPT